MPKQPPIRTRWSPENPEQAKSLLQQLRRVIAKGERHTHANQTTSVTVELPGHIANYILDAIGQIGLGISADDALGLTAPKGRPRKEERDTLLATQAGQDASIESITEIATQFGIHNEDSAMSAYKNGLPGREFVEQLREDFGDGVAQDFITSLSRKAPRKN